MDFDTIIHQLAFRQTVHAYGTDLCWTPMILAKEFNRSSIARHSGALAPLLNSICFVQTMMGLTKK